MREILKFKKELIEAMIKREVIPFKKRVDRLMASANNLTEEKRKEILDEIKDE
ncbi:MAG: hypothetical protein J7K29_02990 [Candidatus Cloacimonetes bacterium]|nr:hypothetical protein [Candidatus Cloacimonadota bacterium]